MYFMLMKASYSKRIRYLTTCLFEQFQGFGDEITQVEALSLTVLDVISDVDITIAEQVEDWEDLTVVWNKCLANHLSTQY